MKKNQIWLMVIVVVLIIMYSGQKEYKKEAGPHGETITRTITPSSGPDGQVFTVTLTIDGIPTTEDISGLIVETKPSDFSWSTGWDKSFEWSGVADYDVDSDLLEIPFLIQQGAVPITSAYYTYTVQAGTESGVISGEITWAGETTPGPISGEAYMTVGVSCTLDSECEGITPDTYCMDVYCDQTLLECVSEPINEGNSCDPPGEETQGVCEAGVCTPSTQCWTCQCYGVTCTELFCGTWDDACNGEINCGECDIDQYCNMVTGQCAMHPSSCSRDSDCNDDNICTLDECISGQCDRTAKVGQACKTPVTQLDGTCTIAGVCQADDQPVDGACQFYQEEGDDGECKLAGWVIIVLVIFGAMYALNMLSR